MNLAPIALFAYRRPDHLRRVLDSLRANPEAGGTRLIVFSDGPKGEADRAAVEQVRNVVAAAHGFASVQLVAREHNAGLASSIISGVNQILAQSGQVIVVEDDLVVSSHFLRYMNQGLQLYAADECVASIHAYVYPVRGPLPQTFFMRGADCWGWATWSRAWRFFEPDGSLLLRELKQRGLTRSFDLGGAYPYTRMLEDQIAGRNDSWAIRWHASTFLRDMLTLYPGRSLVQNIGHDGSGTHSGASDSLSGPLAESPVHVERLSLQEHDGAAREIAGFLRSLSAPKTANWTSRLRGLLRTP